MGGESEDGGVGVRVIVRMEVEAESGCGNERAYVHRSEDRNCDGDESGSESGDTVTGDTVTSGAVVTCTLVLCCDHGCTSTASHTRYT